PQYVDCVKSLPRPLPPATIAEPTKDEEMDEIQSVRLEPSKVAISRRIGRSSKGNLVAFEFGPMGGGVWRIGLNEGGEV
ncbi:hypothetical protein Tco_0627379, partial [Tanacetum coccineum]